MPFLYFYLVLWNILRIFAAIMKLTDIHIEEILDAGNQFEDKVLQLILRDIKNGNREFLKLIQDPSYEFDDGLSARMRNWYAEKGLLIATRNAENKGKRRLSFINKVWFQIVTYTKEKGMSLEEISTYRDFLLSPSNKYNVSPLEIYTLTASCNLNIVDYYLSLDIETECPFEPATDQILGTTHLINFSQLLREIFFVQEDELRVEGKSAECLVKLITEIDKIRKQLSIPEIIIMKQGIRSYAPQGLSYLPFRQLRYKYDVLYQDDEDNIFGIEIKFVRKANDSTPKSEYSICKTDEEITSAIKNEIRSYLKYKRRNEM